MRWVGRSIAALWLGVVSGCMVGGVVPGQPVPPSAYHVAPPDVLEIIVRPEPQIARQVTVRPDGKISFDLIGDVDVLGKTVEEIRLLLTRALQQYIVQPDVTVVLTQSNSRQYFVLGEVRRPGSYPLIGNTTALHALSAAGGPTVYASLNSSRLVRPRNEGGAAYRVRFADISQAGRGGTNYELMPGDVVYVPPNTSARIGYAIQILLFPLQQIIGLGGRFVTTSAGY